MRKLTIRKHGESRKVEEVPAPKPQEYTRVSLDLAGLVPDTTAVFTTTRSDHGLSAGDTLRVSNLSPEMVRSLSLNSEDRSGRITNLTSAAIAADIDRQVMRNFADTGAMNSGSRNLNLTPYFTIYDVAWELHNDIARLCTIVRLRYKSDPTQREYRYCETTIPRELLVNARNTEMVARIVDDTFYDVMLEVLREGLMARLSFDLRAEFMRVGVGRI